MPVCWQWTLQEVHHFIIFSNYSVTYNSENLPQLHCSLCETGSDNGIEIKPLPSRPHKVCMWATGDCPQIWGWLAWRNCVMQAVSMSSYYFFLWPLASSLQGQKDIVSPCSPSTVQVTKIWTAGGGFWCANCLLTRLLIWMSTADPLIEHLNCYLTISCSETHFG